MQKHIVDDENEFSLDIKGVMVAFHLLTDLIQFGLFIAGVAMVIFGDTMKGLAVISVSLLIAVLGYQFTQIRILAQINARMDYMMKKAAEAEALNKN